MTPSADAKKTPQKQTNDSILKDASPLLKKTAPLKPDWRPLGAVRDYFAEQLRQDQYR